MRPKLSYLLLVVKDQLIACIRTGKCSLQGPFKHLDKTFAKIVCNFNLKPWTNISKKVYLLCLTGSEMFACRWMKHTSYNSKGDISLAANKNGIILIVSPRKI